jgi:hypothetical protein
MRGGTESQRGEVFGASQTAQRVPVRIDSGAIGLLDTALSAMACVVALLQSSRATRTRNVVKIHNGPAAVTWSLRYRSGTLRAFGSIGSQKSLILVEPVGFLQNWEGARRAGESEDDRGALSRDPMAKGLDGPSWTV